MEVQRGSVLSPALPLLALPCPEAVAEVRQLESSNAGAHMGVQLPCSHYYCLTRRAGSYLCGRSSNQQPCMLQPCCSPGPILPPAGIGDAACFLRDIGVVVQYLNRHQLAAQGRPVPRYEPAVQRQIALMARRLVAAAAARGWSALAALLQPAVAACAGGEQAHVQMPPAPNGCTTSFG